MVLMWWNVNWLLQSIVIIKTSHHLVLYIFASKGNRYWRFDGDILDEDYPRDISVGFENIPNDIDAAFAVPAPSHQGKEKAYFFKGICRAMKDKLQHLKRQEVLFLSV